MNTTASDHTTRCSTGNANITLNASDHGPPLCENSSTGTRSISANRNERGSCSGSKYSPECSTP